MPSEHCQWTRNGIALDGKKVMRNMKLCPSSRSIRNNSATKIVLAKLYFNVFVPSKAVPNPEWLTITAQTTPRWPGEPGWEAKSGTGRRNISWTADCQTSWTPRRNQGVKRGKQMFRHLCMRSDLKPKRDLYHMIYPCEWSLNPGELQLQIKEGIGAKRHHFLSSSKFVCCRKPTDSWK